MASKDTPRTYFSGFSSTVVIVLLLVYKKDKVRKPRNVAVVCGIGKTQGRVSEKEDISSSEQGDTSETRYCSTFTSLSLSWLVHSSLDIGILVIFVLVVGGSCVPQLIHALYHVLDRGLLDTWLVGTHSYWCQITYFPHCHL